MKEKITISKGIVLRFGSAPQEQDGNIDECADAVSREYAPILHWRLRCKTSRFWGPISGEVVESRRK